MNKLLVICGPTATGKTKLGIKLAKLFNGEIISADSRQVYKGMDVITGKDFPVNFKFKISNFKYNDKKLSYYLFDSVPVWGLDLVKPDGEFSVAHFVKFARLVINDIWLSKKLPIIVGGTGFWLNALITGVDSLGILPDWELRRKLSNYPIIKLSKMLRKLNFNKWQRMNNSDRNNPRRLVRAIEIILKTQNSSLRASFAGVATEAEQGFGWQAKLKTDKFLKIGLTADKHYLYKLIDKRVEQRVKKGAQQEIEKLIKQGYDWNLPSMTACGYKVWQLYFNHKLTLKETIKHWKNKEHGFSRRQLTWFKKDKNINWFDISNDQLETNVVKFIKSWYYK